MAPTRSQDEYPLSAEQHTPKSADATRAPRKRKAQKDSSDTTFQESGKKRRRQGTTPEDSILLPGSIVGSNNADDVIQIDDDEEEDEEDEEDVKEDHEEEEEAEEEEAEEEDETSLGVPDSETKESSGASERQVSIRMVQKTEEPTKTVDTADPLEDTVPPHNKTDSATHEPSRAKLTKGIHKRFGSEETEIVPPKLDRAEISDASVQVTTSENTGQSHSGEDNSEDEAPEMVTAVAGLDQARKIATRAAGVVKRQDAATKQKRKERDERLKSQARLSKKRDSSKHKLSNKTKNLRDAADKKTVSTPNEENPETFSWSPRDPLPALLPDSVLAAEPPTQTLTPSSDNPPAPKPSRIAKRKLLTPKPPKDVVYGSRTIRVLENSASTLPPRASGSNKALREWWLRGQNVVPRRKLGGGFVRK